MKRKMKMNTIGQILKEKQEKDAIHVAIAPVIANQRLNPGEHIGFIYDDKKTVGITAHTIGIVDPFLTSPVEMGEKFWMFLYPNTITSLRHDWTHPEFIKETSSEVESKKWITNWAAEYNLTYEEVIEFGRNQDFFLGEVCYDNIPEEFWDNFRIITGIEVSEQTRKETYFHCSC